MEATSRTCPPLNSDMQCGIVDKTLPQTPGGVLASFGPSPASGKLLALRRTGITDRSLLRLAGATGSGPSRDVCHCQALAVKEPESSYTVKYSWSRESYPFGKLPK